MTFYQMFKDCPQCSKPMLENYSGTAKNIGGKEHYWDSRECPECGITVTLRQNKLLSIKTRDTHDRV